MTTTTELKTQRATAGAAYVTAAQAYLDAYVELRAHDLAAGNRGLDPLSFGGELPVPAPHGEFLRESIHGAISDRIQARHQQLVAGFNG